LLGLEDEDVVGFENVGDHTKGAVILLDIYIEFLD
jgi:hypothetical protein